MQVDTSSAGAPGESISGNIDLSVVGDSGAGDSDVGNPDDVTPIIVVGSVVPVLLVVFAAIGFISWRNNRCCNTL